MDARVELLVPGLREMEVVIDVGHGQVEVEVPSLIRARTDRLAADGTDGQTHPFNGLSLLVGHMAFDAPEALDGRGRVRRRSRLRRPDRAAVVREPERHRDQQQDDRRRPESPVAPVELHGSSQSTDGYGGGAPTLQPAPLSLEPLGREAYPYGAG